MSRLDELKIGDIAEWPQGEKAEVIAISRHTGILIWEFLEDDGTYTYGPALIQYIKKINGVPIDAIPEGGNG